MDKKESNKEDTRQNIELQIQETFQYLENLNKKQVLLKDAKDLEEMEREIVAATDRLASLMAARKIQESLDSDECEAAVSDLVALHPKKLKNQGRRPVSIRLSRGEPVEIKTVYFSRKGKKKFEKRRKGKGSIRG